MPDVFFLSIQKGMVKSSFDVLTIFFFFFMIISVLKTFGIVAQKFPIFQCWFHLARFQKY